MTDEGRPQSTSRHVEEKVSKHTEKFRNFSLHSRVCSLSFARHWLRSAGLRFELLLSDSTLSSFLPFILLSLSYTDWILLTPRMKHGTASTTTLLAAIKLCKCKQDILVAFLRRFAQKGNPKWDGCLRTSAFQDRSLRNMPHSASWEPSTLHD